MHSFEYICELGWTPILLLVTALAATKRRVVWRPVTWDFLLDGVLHVTILLNKRVFRSSAVVLVSRRPVFCPMRSPQTISCRRGRASCSWSCCSSDSCTYHSCSGCPHLFYLEMPFRLCGAQEQARASGSRWCHMLWQKVVQRFRLPLFCKSSSCHTHRHTHTDIYIYNIYTYIYIYIYIHIILVCI